jgi:hypothetical protein
MSSNCEYLLYTLQNKVPERTSILYSCNRGVGGAAQSIKKRKEEREKKGEGSRLTVNFEPPRSRIRHPTTLAVNSSEEQTEHRE